MTWDSWVAVGKDSQPVTWVIDFAEERDHWASEICKCINKYDYISHNHIHLNGEQSTHVLFMSWYGWGLNVMRACAIGLPLMHTLLSFLIKLRCIANPLAGVVYEA